MKKLELLVLELKNNSLKISECVANEDFEKAYELSKYHLVILDELNEVFSSCPDCRVRIKTLCEELMHVEFDIINEISVQKKIIAEKLINISKLNDIERKYKKIAEE